MEIDGAEARTETGLGYFGVSNRNGLRILQEKGTKGGDEMENAVEVAMEAKKYKNLRFFEDLVSEKKGNDDSKVEILEPEPRRRADDISRQRLVKSVRHLQ